MERLEQKPTGDYREAGEGNQGSPVWAAEDVGSGRRRAGAEVTLPPSLSIYQVEAVQLIMLYSVSSFSVYKQDVPISLGYSDRVISQYKSIKISSPHCVPNEYPSSSSSSLFLVSVLFNVFSFLETGHFFNSLHLQHLTLAYNF